MSPLHVHLLLALRAATRFGCSAEDLLTDMRRGAHRDLSLPALEAALRDLADKSFASKFNTALDAERWKVTGLGRDALAEEGL